MRGIEAIRRFGIRATSQTLIVATLVGVMAEVVAAQDRGFPLRLPKVGSRVRLTSLSTPGARVTGILRAVYGDSLVVQKDRDSSAVALAQADLGQVEVRVGEERAEQLATAFGIAGAIGGGTIYVNWCRKNPADCQRDAWGDPNKPLICHGDDCPEGDAHFAVPMLLIVGGALLGGAIGYAIASPRWAPVVGGAPMRIGVAPLGTRGVAVGARLSVGQFGRGR